MERQHLAERALYVPRGRREAQAANPTESTAAASKKRHPREESAADESAGKPKSNSRASSSSPPENQNDVDSDSATVKAGSATSATTNRRTELYVPKGRRELNEQKPSTGATNATKGQESTVDSTRSVSLSTCSSSSSTAKKKEPTPPSVESIPISNLALNHETKAKDSTWGIYVPRGRRELNEKKAAEPANSSQPTQGSTTGAGGAGDEDSAPRPPKAKLSAYTKWDSSEDEDEGAGKCGSSVPTGNAPVSSAPPPAPSQDDLIGDSCLVLSGVPPELSDAARSNITAPYLDKGATVRWSGVSECLIVFKSDRAATSAVPPAGTSIFRIMRLRDVSQPARTAHIEAARDLFAPVKPERDSTVANRLIGAALGIRLPKPAKPSAAMEARSRAARAPSPPRVDAWDD